jgi:putative effector of murein hydrolase
VRSITTPFAIEAEKVLGGPTDLAALFVLLTGVSAMLLGETVLRVLPRIRSKLATGASWGGAAHGSGVARARQAGEVQAVMASLVMMIAGAVNVLAAPGCAHCFSERRSRTAPAIAALSAPEWRSGAAARRRRRGS